LALEKRIELPPGDDDVQPQRQQQQEGKGFSSSEPTNNPINDDDNSDYGGGEDVYYRDNYDFLADNDEEVGEDQQNTQESHHMTAHDPLRGGKVDINGKVFYAKPNNS